MMTQPAAADIDDVRLPLTFILSGIFLFVFSQGLLLSALPDLIHGTVQIPFLLMIAHLLVLGFGTMVAMGVMVQLVPVALQTKIHHPKLARIQYIIYIIGVVGIGWSFFQFSATRLLIFAAVTVFAVLLFEFNLWHSLITAGPSDIRTAVGSALLSLLITVGLGLWLAIDFFHPHLGTWHDSILAVHILFGTVGWFTMLIVGFSYKLAPMFTLSHGYESRYGTIAIYGLDIGLVICVIGILSAVWFIVGIGAILILAGFICYGIQMKKILQHRMRKKFDPGVAAALCAMPFTLILLAAVAVDGGLTSNGISVPALVYLVLIGWVALTILGYLYKIIPFLWWTYKYGKVIGKQKTPNLKEMLNEKHGKILLTLLFASVCLNTVGVLTHSVSLGWIGQAAIFTVSFFYVLELTLVLRK